MDDVPSSSSALFPPRAVSEQIDDRLTRSLSAALLRVALGSVVPSFDQARFAADLAGFDFQSPRPLQEMLDWSTARLEEGVVHMTHPRYFGLFNPAPSFPSQCADRVVGAFNPQLATWKTSPVAVAIESHVIQAVASRAGFPSGSAGHFTSGGSEANLTAVLCALAQANPRFAEEGTRAFSGSPVFYISRESHLAWIKIALETGLGRAAARLVQTDGSGRMDARALQEMLALDRARGCVPFLIVATAGTTNAGMIDPLDACRDVARRENVWYHVDAAWGGGVLASERLVRLVHGIQDADSITVDAHKWFATTMGCGMFITRHAPVLSSAFQVATGFMPSNVADLDPYVTSVQWSRRFLGLRLFLALASAGWSGYAQHVERAVGLIAVARAELEARGWSIANRSEMAVLCVEPPPGSAEVTQIASRVLASGQAWVAAATFEGRPTIRICVTHGQTELEDIQTLVDTLHASRVL